LIKRVITMLAILVGLTMTTGVAADASTPTGDGWCWGKGASCSVVARTDAVCRSVACSAPSGIEYGVTSADTFCTPWKVGC